jgi:hypothetical protein
MGSRGNCHEIFAVHPEAASSFETAAGSQAMLPECN